MILSILKCVFSARKEIIQKFIFTFNAFNTQFHRQGMIFYKNTILKNLLFLISTFLFTVTTEAQLYVKPNGTDASYVYVKDVVLYVENNIELYENEDSTTEKASMYFRDEGQLYPRK